MAIQAVTIVSPNLGTHGWPFASVDQFPGAEVDPLYNSEHIKDLYLRADPNYSARFVTLVSPTSEDAN
jgi:putative glutathione S-transferase